MLWDLIRDFFVMHVFGGVASTGVQYATHLGNCFTYIEGNYEDGWYADTLENVYQVGFYNGTTLQPMYITISDWLSTTATIISISIIVIMCCLFIYKIIRLIGGLIR